jgi:hypothetical protein
LIILSMTSGFRVAVTTGTVWASQAAAAAYGRKHGVPEDQLDCTQ